MREREWGKVCDRNRVRESEKGDDGEQQHALNVPHLRFPPSVAASAHQIFPLLELVERVPPSRRTCAAKFYVYFSRQGIQTSG